MTEIVNLLLVGGLGLCLGGFFFGGLWWTIQKIVVSGYPAVWILTSLLLRMGVTLFGFYWVLSNELGYTPLLRLFSCLLGFALARLLIGRLSKLTSKKDTTESIRSLKRSQHAPQPR